jgi:hypothetical protein
MALGRESDWIWGGTFALVTWVIRKILGFVQLIHLHLEYTRPVGILGFARKGIESFFQLSFFAFFNGRINVQ